jgi:microcystin degradation protein MlrC
MKQLRLFVASVFQETNEFSPIPTSFASYKGMFWRPRDDAKPPANLNMLGYGAVLRRARELGLDVVPGLFAACVPAAPIDAGGWEKLKSYVLDDLRAALPVDLVFLFLHGAQSVQGLSDADGDLLEAVRAIVGPTVKIAAEFDLHGNLTAKKLANADFVIACKEYPHVDFEDEGVKALDLLIRAARGEIKPTMAAARVPMMVIGPTTSEPMKSYVADLRKLEEQPGVLSVSAFHGFFAADHADVGAMTIAITDANGPRAQALALDLGQRFANVARQQGSLGVGIESALDRAQAAKRTVIIADRADNSGGGAASDSTFILEAMLKRGMRDAALGLLWDPIAVDFCHAAGEGAELALRIGGKVGPMSGRPLDVHAKVLALRDDVRQAWFGRGEPVLPIGKSAAIRVDGIDIVLNSNRHQIFSRHAFEGHGIDLSAKKAIVVKSTQHFYEAYHALGDVIYCDAPGTVTMDFTTIPYKHIRRPIYPLDTDFEIKPSLVTI